MAQSSAEFEVPARTERPTPLTPEQYASLTPAQIGARVDMMRRNGIRWKRICAYLGKDEVTLRKHLHHYLGRDLCRCPKCGTEFDPKQYRKRQA